MEASNLGNVGVRTRACRVETLLDAAFSTHSSILIGQDGVEKSVDAARTSAYATLQSPDPGGESREGLRRPRVHPRDERLGHRLQRLIVLRILIRLAQGWNQFAHSDPPEQQLPSAL